MSTAARPSETTHGLHLPAHEYEIVAAILRHRIPGRRVWAFGSRAAGTRLKRFSDLDLAVEGSLTLTEHGHLDDRLRRIAPAHQSRHPRPRPGRSRLPRPHRPRLRLSSRVIWLLP